MTNGMKPGSGTDPFADAESDKTGEESEEHDDRAVEESAEPPQTSETEEIDEESTASTSTAGLPFIYARDGVKQARNHTFQLHYLDNTYQQEKRVQSQLEERLGEDIYKVDLREAMIQAAFENLDDVEEILREWGYDAE